MEFYVIATKNRSGDWVYLLNNGYNPSMVVNIFEATRFAPKSPSEEIEAFSKRVLDSMNLATNQGNLKSHYALEYLCVKKVVVDISNASGECWNSAYKENALSKLTWCEAEALGIVEQLTERKIAK